MKKRVNKIVFILSMVVFVNVSCSDSLKDRTSLNTLKNPISSLSCDTILSKRVKGADLEKDVDKLLKCGLDSADIPLVGSVVMNKLQNKEEFDTLTYREVISIIENMNSIIGNNLFSP